MHIWVSEKCIDTDQNEKNEYVPGQQAIMRYQERGVSEQLKKNLMHVIKQNGSIKCDTPVNQSTKSIIKVMYVGPPPKPVYFCMN